MSKVIIFGSNGQLGQACAKKWSDAVLFNRTEIDVCNESDIVSVLHKYKPEFVINAAAYTNVERAEIDPSAALNVNGIAPMFLARATKKIGAILVHISTDYVFDGEGSKCFSEESTTHPINFYGLSKRFGEENIEAYGEKYYILRTSALFGEKTGDKDENFVFKRMFQVSNNQDISMVDDQWTVPTYTNDLADCIMSVLENKLPYGVYHAVSNGEPVSWFGFTKRIVHELGLDDTTVNSIATLSSGTSLNRPRYSVLSNKKLAAAGIMMPDWKDSLAKYITVSRKKIPI